MSLDELREIIERHLATHYLGISELRYIGIARPRNADGGPYAIRFGIDAPCTFREKLLDDAALRGGPYEVWHNSTHVPIQKILIPEDWRRHDILRPGMLISGAAPGAITAIVVQQEGTFVLGNAHVLGPVNTEVYQPRVLAGHRREYYRIGKVKAVDESLDCAIASIDDREYDNFIKSLNVTPVEIEPPALGDRVVKYGLKTGLTYGIVRCIHAICPRSHQRCVKDQFIIEPDRSRRPANDEISVPGDSGSPWLKLNTSGQPSTVLLGMECGGDASSVDSNLAAEYARAATLSTVQDALNISLFT